MLDVVGVGSIVIACLVLSSFAGKRKKQSGLALAESEPAKVARLYLRKASDVDAYWLHVQMTNGRKYCIAAPWDVEATLSRLARVGLHLPAQERALFEAVARA